MADTEIDVSMGRCDGCGTHLGPLYKLSLGKDFFDRPYDRLSPSADRSPKWYCATCSLQKNLQRDFRDIQEELAKWNAGQRSELDHSDQLERARLRLQEITLLVDKADANAPFLTRNDVIGVMEDLAKHLSPGSPQRDATRT